MNQIVNAGFDYTQLDKETAGKLKNYAKSGNSLIKRAHVKFIADFGEILSSARQVLANHGNGIFVSWAVAEFEFSKTTIYRYINAWDRCLSIGGYDNVTPTALHRISEESTPQEIRDKVLKLAKKQITVTNADVDVLMPKDCPTVGQTPLHGGNSGEEGRTDSDGTEPTEETAHQPAEDGTESAGEDVGATNTEWDDVEEEEATDDTSIVLDAIGRPVPESFREAHGLSAAIQVEGRKLDAILRKLKELSQEPGGEFIGSSVIETELKALKGRIFGACYWSECPKCKGGKCGDCSNSGWWPKKKSGHLSVADKEWLGVE
jgi:hypothetical protein